MIGNRYSGDNIAADFLRLIKSNAPQEETLEVRSSNPEPVEENNAKDNVDPKDFLVRNNAVDSNNVIKDLENKIDDFGGIESPAIDLSAPTAPAAVASNNVEEARRKKANVVSLAPDKRTLKILNGLGKIAGSLRSKGEGFAADVVEATAMSVKSESLNEAKKKAFVLSELDKISNDLKDENNVFASDLVLATANKILKY